MVIWSHFIRFSSSCFLSSISSFLSRFHQETSLLHTNRLRMDTITVCFYYWERRLKKHWWKWPDWNCINFSRAAPSFVPSQHCLNCDPMYEIEERVVVSTPIHDRRGRGRKSSKVWIVWGSSLFDSIKITRTIRNTNDRELTSFLKQGLMTHSIHWMVWVSCVCHTPVSR